MKYTALVILAILICATSIFAEDCHIFVIDENGKPIYGYKIIKTSRDDIFWGKLEPIKKWILLSKSELYISKDGYIYPVVDSIIVDKSKGLVIFFIDLADKKPQKFPLDKVIIDGDIRAILNNINILKAKFNSLFPKLDEKREIKSSEERDINLLLLAKNYETRGHFEKALDIYEEILKKENSNNQIIEKLSYLYYKTGNFKKARENLKKLPQNDENIKKLVGILIIEKKFDEAIKILSKSEFQDKSYFNYLRGIIYYLTEKKDDAYKELLELSRENKELFQSLRELLR